MEWNSDVLEVVDFACGNKFEIGFYGFYEIRAAQVGLDAA
jgi:hypothetical protein